jgi:hypothetical protein
MVRRGREGDINNPRGGGSGENTFEGKWVYPGLQILEREGPSDTLWLTVTATADPNLA